MASLLIPPPEDPVRAAAQWLGEAEALGRRNANAMALASVDLGCRPSVRMVLLKELAPLGYAVFYTNYGSRKGAELLATRRAAGVPGDPKHPVTREAIEAKFRDCVAFSAKPLEQANVDRAIALVRDLENVGDVAEIMELLTPVQ